MAKTKFPKWYTKQLRDSKRKLKRLAENDPGGLCEKHLPIAAMELSVAVLKRVISETNQSTLGRTYHFFHGLSLMKTAYDEKPGLDYNEFNIYALNLVRESVHEALEAPTSNILWNASWVRR